MASYMDVGASRQKPTLSLPNRIRCGEVWNWLRRFAFLRDTVFSRICFYAQRFSLAILLGSYDKLRASVVAFTYSLYFILRVYRGKSKVEPVYAPQTSMG